MEIKNSAIVWRKSSKHGWNIYCHVIEKRLPYFLGMAIADLIRNGEIEKIQLGVVSFSWGGGNYNEADRMIFEKIKSHSFDILWKLPEVVTFIPLPM